MSHLGQLIRRQREAQGLSRPELARLLGYRNINRGCRRIVQLENCGDTSKALWAKVTEALDFDDGSTARAVERDRTEYEAEWAAWADHPVPMHLSIKWFPGFYAGHPLPPEVADDPALAEKFACRVAKEEGRLVCLTVSRRLSVWIDDEGEVFSRQQVQPGEHSGPQMRLSR